MFSLLEDNPMNFFKILKSNKNIDLKIEKESVKISTNLEDNLKSIENKIGSNIDFSSKIFNFNNKNSSKTAIIFLSSIVDKNTVNNLSLELSKLIKIQEKTKDSWFENPNEYFEALLKLPLTGRKISILNDLESIYEDLLSGNTIIMVNEFTKCLSVNTGLIKARAVEEPSSQTVIKGPKEGFVEGFETNISLIRKRIRNTSLKIENIKLGNLTKTNVSIMYLEDIAKTEIINEVKRRLDKIDIDVVLESGYIEELIQDDRYTIFPTIISSERPDVICSGLCEGRVAILVDGTPFVIIVPNLFIDFFQVSEDYYQNFYVASLFRAMRYFTFMFSLTVPSLYIALTSFNQEMIPTPLLLSIASQRDGLPFPAFIEAILMEIAFEILKEAGVRMPRVIGGTISIVGALVLGQTAVEAGIVSSVMVIIVSFTAISSFTFPYYSLGNAVRITRFGFMIISSIFGMYGLFVALIMLTLHLCKIKSLGIPFMSISTPCIERTKKSSVFRKPQWKVDNKYIK